MKKLIALTLIAAWFLIAFQSDFLAEQKKYSRVKLAYKEKEKLLADKLKQENLNLNNFELLFIGYKAEKELNLFIKQKGTKQYRLFQTYSICNSSGDLGPKSRQGDGQVPEGFYHINRFNPSSNFYLSLGLNYPNAADLIRAQLQGSPPGGDIFIHGECVTVGCLPMTNDIIKEIYVLAIQARYNGQTRIPVYIFPFRMTDENMGKYSKENNVDKVSFWEKLKPGNDAFEKTKAEVKFGNDKFGNYKF